jgi:hypothetical protein
MLKQVRDTLDGKSKSGKPTTKSGHISDVEFEPLPPLLVFFVVIDHSEWARPGKEEIFMLFSCIRHHL